MRWETCRPERLSHWLHRKTYPQDSHSEWYRKWGKTIAFGTNIDSGTKTGGRSIPPGNVIRYFMGVLTNEAPNDWRYRGGL